MTFELDRTSSVFLLQIWRPTSFVADEAHTPASVSPAGTIVGHSQVIAPESDRERWATFDLNLFRKTPVNPTSLIPLLAIDEEGRIHAPTPTAPNPSATPPLSPREAGP
jgi:hypothetical protein